MWQEVSGADECRLQRGHQDLGDWFLQRRLPDPRVVPRGVAGPLPLHLGPVHPLRLPQPRRGLDRLWVRVHGPAPSVGMAVGDLRPQAAGPLQQHGLRRLLHRWGHHRHR